MPKHSVPKKKTSKGRTTRRYASFANAAKKRILNGIHLVDCPDCGNKKLNHYVCPNCGKYKGRQVIDKEKKIEKITKIKA